MSNIMDNPYLQHLNSFPKNKKCGHTCVSLFSGGGGLDLGAHFAGFKSLFVSDLMPTYTKTIKRNIPSVQVYNDDAMALTADKIKKLAGIDCSPDITIAGPPCQAFSILGSRKSMDDPRGLLTPKYFELVVGLQPKAFLFENVPGLLSVNGGKDFENLWKYIEKTTGYTLFKQVVKATTCGVPQLRERLIIVGFRPDIDCSTFKFPTQATTKKGTDLPALVPSRYALENVEGLPNHEPRKHTPEVEERFKKLDWGKRDRGSFCDRIHPDYPSHTVVIGSSKGGARPHVHPTAPRVISVREAARLQGFPDWYVFEGSQTEQYRQVGNAVPPLLAYEVLRNVKLVLERNGR